MRKRLPALAALLVLPVPAVAMVASCPAEQAHYRQAGATGVAARLVRAGQHGTAASDLLFVVRLKAHDYRFRFQQANGYGGVSLDPLPPRDGDDPPDREDEPPIRFVPYRADLTEIADAPRSGGRPPAVIVLPDLGAALWYDAAALGGPAERQVMSRSAFVLAGCGRGTGTGKAGR